MMEIQAIRILIQLGIAGSLFCFTGGCHSGNDKNESGDQPVVLDEDPVTSELLVDDEGVILVRTNCTGCHSEKLVTQNRATREGWESTIRWMQKTQNLWDLGSNEDVILDYLAKNYAPQNKGRRENLEIEWYALDE